MAKKPRKPRQYINNEHFYECLVGYLDECNEAELKGEQIPRIPEYIGECFILLAKNVGKAPNYSRYTYLEEMQSDAIINCVKYVRNFNPAFGKNPFAYFTQYVNNTFKQRIRIEKKKMYTRYKEYQSFQVSEQLEYVTGGNYAGGPELNEISNEFIRQFERSMVEEKEKKRINRIKSTNSIGNYFEDVNGDEDEDRTDS